jgi:hypothetical protein
MAPQNRPLQITSLRGSGQAKEKFALLHFLWVKDEAQPGRRGKNACQDQNTGG